MILAIETSSNLCSVAIFHNNSLLGSINISGLNVHDKLLAVITEQLLNNLDINFNQITHISTNNGPGSFTGLRIGLSFAKGLIFGKDIKLIANTNNEIIYSTIDNSILNQEIKKIATLVNAGNSNYYYMMYDRASGAIINDLQLIQYDELIKNIDNNTLLIGNFDDSKFENLIYKQYIEILAEHQLKLAYKNIEIQNYSDLDTIKPLYLNEINYKINK